MRYLAARQRQADGKWDWTCLRNDIVLPWPPCHEGCNHATREEAEQHHYDYEMEKLRESTQDIKCRCEFPGCEEWSNKVLHTRLFDAAYLCDAHRSSKVFQQLHPFAPNREIWES